MVKKYRIAFFDASALSKQQLYVQDDCSMKLVADRPPMLCLRILSMVLKCFQVDWRQTKGFIRLRSYCCNELVS